MFKGSLVLWQVFGGIIEKSNVMGFALNCYFYENTSRECFPQLLFFLAKISLHSNKNSYFFLLLKNLIHTSIFYITTESYKSVMLDSV